MHESHSISQFKGWNMLLWFKIAMQTSIEENEKEDKDRNLTINSNNMALGWLYEVGRANHDDSDIVLGLSHPNGTNGTGNFYCWAQCI